MMKEMEPISDVFEELEMLTEHKETWFDDEIEQSFLQGCEKGREEGRKKALMFVARNMLKSGKSVKEIAEATGLQPAVIQSLVH